MQLFYLTGVEEVLVKTLSCYNIRIVFFALESASECTECQGVPDKSMPDMLEI